jgi:predicted DNA-binding transcriptional regulator AlpA
VKIKPKDKSATSPLKALPGQSSELRGWPAIAQFLGMPNSTVHRWAKEGMPVRREGRNVVASPEELNQWLQRTSGEAVGVHVATLGSDLLKDLRASVAAQKGTKNSSPRPKNETAQSLRAKALKTKGLSRKS